MTSNTHHTHSLIHENHATNTSRQTYEEIDVNQHWRPVNLNNESFHVSSIANTSNPPSFNIQTATLLDIFLNFITHSLVVSIANDIDPTTMLYGNNSLVLPSLQSIYILLSIWIRIYGERHQSDGVISRNRSLREQLQWYQQHFKNAYPNVPTLGITYMEILSSHFLFDCRYSNQLSVNFRSILRGIGNVVVGNEKSICFRGRIPNVSVAYMKPDSVGLWIYELCVKLSNNESYMLDIWLHDAISVLEESIPVSTVVKHWSKIIHSFNSTKMADTLLELDLYNMHDAAIEALAEKNVKFIAVVNPQRFPTITRVLSEGVYAVGAWKGLWNEVRKELVVHSYTNDGSEYTALSNAYIRIETKSERQSEPVWSDYDRMFNACAVFNNQVKSRVWPHRHGGRSYLSEMRKFNSFAFGCVLQNTFNAYCEINGIARTQDDYYSLCESLANQVYAYAGTLSNAPVDLIDRII